jgi:hypothetical protein
VLVKEEGIQNEETEGAFKDYQQVWVRLLKQKRHDKRRGYQKGLDATVIKAEQK